jgi:hypothetical protein
MLFSYTSLIVETGFQEVRSPSLDDTITSRAEFENSRSIPVPQQYGGTCSKSSPSYDFYAATP